MALIDDLKKRLAEGKRQRKAFFSDAKEEIARYNLILICKVGLFAIALLLFFMLITPVIFTGWRVTWEYIAFLMGMTAFVAAAWLVGRKEENYRFWQLLCIGFQITLLVFVIMIDVFPYANGTCSYMPVILVMLPAVFTMNYPVIMGLTTGAEIIFILLVLAVKNPKVWQNDIYNSLVGLLFSYVLAWLVLQLRVEDYLIKSRLKRISSEDKLTGVLNKGSCESAAEEYIKGRNRENSCGFVVMDVDDFKVINDRMGHQTGDRILSEIGELLSNTFRTTDIVGRIGGDEFMVLVRNVNGIDNLKKKCVQIRESIEQFQIQQKKSVTCSIGAAYIEREAFSFEEVFRMADDALYEAKALGKNRYVVHRPSEQNKLKNKKVMLLAVQCEECRTNLASLFREEYEVIEAKDGVETLNRLGEYRECIDIAMIDEQMEKMNGFEILKYMKSRIVFADIPVIITISDESGEEQALTLGANDMLKKPVDPVIAKLSVARVTNS